MDGDAPAAPTVEEIDETLFQNMMKSIIASRFEEAQKHLQNGAIHFARTMQPCRAEGCTNEEMFSVPTRFGAFRTCLIDLPLIVKHLQSEKKSVTDDGLDNTTTSDLLR